MTLPGETNRLYEKKDNCTPDNEICPRNMSGNIKKQTNDERKWDESIE